MSSEDEITCTAFAWSAPKYTESFRTKLPPRIVTFVPPFFGPNPGPTPDRLGAGTKLNLSALEVLEAPAAVVSSTSTSPDAVAGEVATQLVVDEQLTALARVEPNLTVVAPGLVKKPVPVMATRVPPATGPELGNIPVTLGEDGGLETISVHWA